MNNFVVPIAILAATLLCDTTLVAASSQIYHPDAQVWFSPKGGTAAAVVQEINSAKSRIRVQAYSFTNVDIAKALVAAKRRGIDVIAVLDKSNKTGKYSAADFVAHGGIPTYIDSKHPIAHNKIMIIDDATVITGSFNFTKAAEDGNAENLLVLRSRELVARYMENWTAHQAHSEAYAGR